EDRPEVTLPPRKRLGCPERLGYDRQMRVILSVETDCDFRDAEGRSYEIYKDYRVEDNHTGTCDSPTGIGDSFKGTGYRLQGQQGPAGGPTQPELPEEAGSSS
nr:hypothetical protein [Tanacetum cinerariifolium]